MPIEASDYKPTGLAGCKWNRRSRNALFDVRGPDGKRVRRVFPFESVEDAKGAFPDFRAKVKAGEFSDVLEVLAKGVQSLADVPEGITLADYVPAHWDSLHVRCIESTQRTNDNVYRNHLAPFFGAMSVAAIAEHHCEDFSTKMKTDGFSPYTTNLALRVLRKVLHHARRRDVRAAVPDDFHFQREPLLKLELNDSEQDRFFAAFDDDDGFRQYLAQTQNKGKVVRSARFGFKERRFGGGLKPDSEAASIYFQRFRTSRLIFTAAVDLGYRETDLRLLKRKDVDVRNGFVSITTRKTSKTATVPLSDRCRDAITEAMSQPIVSTEYVFCMADGKPYSESTLRRYYAIAKHLSSITRRCRLNDLRHTFGSNLASEGLSLIEIRDALGHTSTRTTERYAKPDGRSLERMRVALNARRARTSLLTLRDPQKS